MTVSILIHNLNRPSALWRCLQSVLRQNYRPLEAVVLDAGSTNSSWAAIEECTEQMRECGINVRVERCSPMGVASSRNLAASVATGSLLCFIDNDAAFESPDCVSRAVSMFENDARLALISFRVLKADSAEIDRSAWVFRRRADVWSTHPFATFTFAGTAFCVRAECFQEAGGFWDYVRYSREEEDLAMELIKRDWKIVYQPSVSVRHYSDPRGRSSLAQRRYAELRNGILVLWRRLPIPIALLAISGRIGTMSLRTVLKEKQSLRELLPAIADSIRDWRVHRLQRAPIGVRSAWKYALLHLGI